MATQIEDPENKINKKSFALFALGFRPFFLFAAVSAPALLFLWLMQLSGKISVSAYYSQLLLLSIVFLSARFAPFIPDIPNGLIAFLDLSFIPLVAFLVAIPVIQAKQWSNFIFVPLLLTMAAANLMVHLSALGLINSSMVTGSRLMLYLIVLLVVIMGGRVIPFFTERGVNGVTTKKWKPIEILSPISIVLVVIADVVYTDRVIIGYLALFAAIIHFVRLAGWYSNKIWQVPLVWILQLAYAWFIIGFIIKSLMIFNLTESIFSYHAFTVGGIGIMTLGMMARVSLGHTGREMKLDRWMVLSFILINIAALTRVILPMFFTDNYLQLIQVSGWLWIFSFVIFIVVYTPMWIRSRVDGREG